MITTPITLGIIAITVIVSYTAFSNRALFDKLLLHPYSVKHRKEYYRLLSHVLLHSDWTHLLFNMYTFWSFGTFLEQLLTKRVLFTAYMPEIVYKGETFGAVAFSLLYIGGGLVATLPAMRKHGDDIYYRSVGASGAVSAMLMCFMFMFPTFEVSFFFILPLPSFIAAFVFFGIEHWLSRQGRTNIAHDAHIWGALFGIAFVGVIDPSLYGIFFDKVYMYIREFF